MHYTTKPVMNGLFQAFRIETTLTQDGTLTLDHLPFQAGETVEVIVLAPVPPPPPQDPYPLRGTPVKYVNMLEPVEELDWEELS